MRFDGFRFEAEARLTDLALSKSGGLIKNVGRHRLNEDSMDVESAT